MRRRTLVGVPGGTLISLNPKRPFIQTLIPTGDSNPVILSIIPSLLIKSRIRLPYFQSTIVTGVGTGIKNKVCIGNDDRARSTKDIPGQSLVAWFGDDGCTVGDFAFVFADVGGETEIVTAGVD